MSVRNICQTGCGQEAEKGTLNAEGVLDAELLAQPLRKLLYLVKILQLITLGAPLGKHDSKSQPQTQCTCIAISLIPIELRLFII